MVDEGQAAARRPLAARRRLGGDRVAALDEPVDEPDEHPPVLDGEHVGDVGAVAFDAHVVDVDPVGHGDRDQGVTTGHLVRCARHDLDPEAVLAAAAVGRREWRGDGRDGGRERGDERECDRGDDEPGT